MLVPTWVVLRFDSPWRGAPFSHVLAALPCPLSVVRRRFNSWLFIHSFPFHRAASLLFSSRESPRPGQDALPSPLLAESSTIPPKKNQNRTEQSGSHELLGEVLSTMGLGGWNCMQYLSCRRRDERQRGEIENFPQKSASITSLSLSLSFSRRFELPGGSQFSCVRPRCMRPTVYEKLVDFRPKYRW